MSEDERIAMRHTPVPFANECRHKNATHSSLLLLQGKPDEFVQLRCRTAIYSVQYAHEGKTEDEVIMRGTLTRRGDYLTAL